MSSYLETAGLSIRDALPADLGFVCSSWLASYEKPFVTQETPDPHWVPKSILSIRKAPKVLKALYTKEERIVIHDILELRPAKVVFDIENPDFIVAWFVGTKGHLDYIYVKQDFRRSGLAKVLIENFEPIQTVGHLTKAGLELMRSCGQTPHYIG